MSLKGPNEKFSLLARTKSFKYAFSGLFMLFREEHNALIHLVILILVIIGGFVFKISGIDWIAIAIVSGMVFGSECFNTAVENLSDFVSPGSDDQIRKIKDVAAGGVLVSAISAIVVGLIIFIPELVEIFR